MTLPDTDRRLIVSLHDVHPHTHKAYAPFLQQLTALGVTPTCILAVPHWHGRLRLDRAPACGTWLRALADEGHEMVLHGYRHRERSPCRGSMKERCVAGLYTDGEGEFYRLSYASAARRLATGSAVMHRQGLHPRGFVAPAWLYSKDAIDAVGRSGLQYLCTLRHVHLLAAGGRLRAPVLSLSSRALWRRLASVAWGEAFTRATHREPIVRIAVHPLDLEYPIPRRALLRWVARVAAQRQITTYGRLVESCRPEETTRI
jgi:predicted deacetylase